MEVSLTPKIVFFVLGLLAVGALLGSSSFSADTFEENLRQLSAPSSSYRLNLTVLPLQYTLRMRPVLDPGFLSPLDQFTSPSSVLILVRSISNSSANTITLHQRDLEIDLDSVTVTDVKSGTKLPILFHSFDLNRDLYNIGLGKSFELGDLLQLDIPYKVNLSQTENTGIYLGHYEDPLTNQTRYLSTTKLEPYHARKVFPLFDEPSLKATFKISVGRLEGKYHSLSNMEIISTEPDLEYPGWVWDNYAETVLMSPYLVCMIVSDFQSASVLDSKNRSVSAWAPAHDIQLGGGDYGALTGSKILTYFENKFKMPYALPKLDAVALPQFTAGAMENFGLVTYRYAYLVWIPGEGTEAERRKITQVLAHEIAHQWYGNVVTCAWWSEIWLNEGFARFFQFWGMGEVIPEFEIEEAFINDAVQLAMAFDQGPNTHPVRNGAQSPNESAAVFDRISYEKGASLLKMTEWILTKPVFETGMIDLYLQRMKWSSAYQEDLFQAMQDAVELHNVSHLLPEDTSIKQILNGWTLQSGFPLVRVGAVHEETISLSQEKFSANGPNTLIIEDEDEASWWIPVKVFAGHEEALESPTDLWLPQNVTETQMYTWSGLNTSKLVMVNADGLGYYRVLYDEKLTELIRQQLINEHSVISSSSRSQLIDDYFNLAWANYIEVETALGMTEYLGRETKSNVWLAALSHLKPILSRFTQDEAAENAFQEYFGPRLETALASIEVRQLVGEKGINVTLRAQLLEMACQLGSESCLDYALDLIQEWKGKPEVNPFPVDIQSVLYCTVSQFFGDLNGTLEFLLERFDQARKDGQRTLLLNGLACSTDQITLSVLLELSLTSSVLKQYKSLIWTRVALNPVGRKLTYDFVKSNVLLGRLTPEEFASVVATLSAYWKEEADGRELQQFMEANGNMLEPVLESLTISLKNVEGNVVWWTTFGLRIQAWLENNAIRSMKK